MRRREFLERFARSAGLAGAVPAAKLMGCGAGSVELGVYGRQNVNFDGSVLVLGAGAAGLAAGYLLSRYGIDYTVVEASNRIGGRVRRNTSLASFPIDVGAEWIHEEPDVLARLIDDPNVEGSVDLVPYTPQSISTRSGSSATPNNWFRNYYAEYKFQRSTWFDFLETYFAPAVLPNLQLGRPATRIDTAGARVTVQLDPQTRFDADRLIITVPVSILAQDKIEFVPPLPDAAKSAFAGVDVPAGIKVFLKFSRRFYPDILIDGSPLASESTDKLYYDAAFRKGVADNILGLFWVADAAEALTQLESDAAITEAVLADLDGVFDGQASKYFMDSVVQNWSAEPFIGGAYSVDFANGQEQLIEAAGSVDPRVLFAGEAFAEDFATVHGAMFSGFDAVEAIVAG